MYIYSNFTDEFDSNYFFHKKTNTEDSKVNLDKLLYWIFND